MPTVEEKLEYSKPDIRDIYAALKAHALGLPNDSQPTRDTYNGDELGERFRHNRRVFLRLHPKPNGRRPNGDGQGYLGVYVRLPHEIAYRDFERFENQGIAKRRSTFKTQQSWFYVFSNDPALAAHLQSLINQAHDHA